MTISVDLLSVAYQFMVLFMVVALPVNIVFLVLALAKKGLDLDASGEPVGWFVRYQTMILTVESFVVGGLLNISLYEDGLSMHHIHPVEFGLAGFVRWVLVIAVITISLMIQNRIMKEVFCFTVYALKTRLLGAHTEKFFAGGFVLLFVMMLLSFGCAMIDIWDYVGEHVASKVAEDAAYPNSGNMDVRKKPLINL